MPRYLSLLAAGALVLSVAACGGNSAPQNMGSNNWNASHDQSSKTNTGATTATYGGGTVITAAPQPGTVVVAPAPVYVAAPVYCAPHVVVRPYFHHRHGFRRPVSVCW